MKEALTQVFCASPECHQNLPTAAALLPLGSRAGDEGDYYPTCNPEPALGDARSLTTGHLLLRGGERSAAPLTMSDDPVCQAEVRHR